MKNNFYYTFVCIAISFLVISCSSDDDKSNSSRTQFGIFKVLEDQETVVMNGVIDTPTLNNFNTMVAQYPNIDQININEVEGSANDEINLLVSKRVYDLNISTHLNDNGLIASGGVDFFLAGVRRTMGTNTQIGVHSWGGEDENGQTVTATDFPVGHEHHLPYINYYVSVGFTQQDAEEFYYFTINAAPAEGIHWMTAEEIENYNILKP
jgi:hypothetical protein